MIGHHREREGGGRCLCKKCSVMLSQLKFLLFVSELNSMNSSIFDELFNRVKLFCQHLTKLKFNQVESIDMTHCVSYPFLFTVWLKRYV